MRESLYFPPRRVEKACCVWRNTVDEIQWSSRGFPTVSEVGTTVGVLVGKNPILRSFSSEELGVLCKIFSLVQKKAVRLG